MHSAISCECRKYASWDIDQAQKKKKKELKAETSVVTFRLPILRSLDDLARQIGLDVQKFKEAALPDPA